MIGKCGILNRPLPLDGNGIPRRRRGGRNRKLAVIDEESVDVPHRADGQGESVIFRAWRPVANYSLDFRSLDRRVVRSRLKVGAISAIPDGVVLKPLAGIGSPGCYRTSRGR